MKKRTAYCYKCRTSKGVKLLDGEWRCVDTDKHSKGPQMDGTPYTDRLRKARQDAGDLES